MTKMYIIENEVLRVEISTLGAEMMSIFHKEQNFEYLWQGDPTFWNRRAPILFPIVGKLKNDTLYYNDVAYHMTQHGFARDMNFEVVLHTTDNISFLARHTDETLVKFPFEWQLKITYSLKNSKLSVSTFVINPSSENNLLFSIGFHPAFNIPVSDSGNSSEYTMFFNKDEQADRYMIKNGLIDTVRQPGFVDGKLLLSKELFSQDALVFKNLMSDKITLKSSNDTYNLDFTFEGFPYLGLWSKLGAPFVCIEPWQGIADSLEHDGQFSEKEGVITLAPMKEFGCGYQVDMH